MPPLSPEDIVEVLDDMYTCSMVHVVVCWWPLTLCLQLYVGEKNDCATETDFLCVLELLQTAYQVGII